MGRLSIAQDMLRKSTDYVRRIIAPVNGVGGVTLSCALLVITFRLRTAFSGSSQGTASVSTGRRRRRSSATGGARLVAASTIEELQTGSWQNRTVLTLVKQKY